MRIGDRVIVIGGHWAHLRGSVEGFIGHYFISVTLDALKEPVPIHVSDLNLIGVEDNAG